MTMNDEENIDDLDLYVPGSSSSTSSHPKRKHCRTVKAGTPRFWRHDVLKTPEVIETAVRNNIAVTSLNELTASFIRATGGDPTAVNLSYAQTYMYRAEAIRSIADEIKRSWKPSQILTVHWDGKLMKSLQAGGETQERLPVLVSGIHGVKLLGVPIVEGTKKEKVGPLIAMATVILLINIVYTVLQCLLSTKANTAVFSLS